MVFALIMIGVVGFMVWGHHMFVAGQSRWQSGVLVPVVHRRGTVRHQVFNWTATLYRGHIGFEAPMIYALGFLGLSLSAG